MKILGVSSWTGWGVTFSDGMCLDCAARARVEWRLPPAPPRHVPARPRRVLWPDLALASLVLLAALGVTFGVVVGPPVPRIASPPTAPAPSSRQPASQRVERGPSSPVPSFDAAGSPGFAAPDRAAGARGRVTRASAKRPMIASPRPVSFELASAPEPMDAPSPAPLPLWLAALPQVDVQAP